MMLLNVLLALYIVYADVIREDGYHNYEGQFTVKHKGRMLRVLMSFKSVEMEECALHCVRHLRCKTFNYHNERKDCELTNEDFDKMDVDTITHGWYNYGTPTRVNGEWSSWKNFTECTKTCGDGTKEQWRDCDSPKPAHGGADCKGRMRRRVKCHIRGCPVVNVALWKAAKQSSTWVEANSAAKAVDGSLYTTSCTNRDLNPWWEIDLGELRMIESISVNANLQNSRVNRALLIETRKEGKGSWTLCKDIRDRKKKILELNCIEQSTMAQYLRIRSEEECTLCLYEVKIFGH